MVSVLERTPMQVAQRNIRTQEAMATTTAIVCIAVATIIWGVPLPVLVKILTDAAGISFGSLSMGLKRRGISDAIYDQVDTQADRDKIVQASAHLPAEGDLKMASQLRRDLISS